MSDPQDSDQPLDPNQKFDPGQSIASPNHKSNAAPKRVRKISFKRARQRLISRYGFKEDELDASFKTEDALVQYYLDVASRNSDKETEDELGWEQEDTFDAPQTEKDRIARSKLAQGKAKYKIANPTTGMAPAQSVGADGKIEPIVSLDEFLKAGEGLDDLDEFLRDDLPPEPSAPDKKK